MTILSFLEANYITILFFIAIVVIVFFTELSIDKIVVIIGLVGFSIVLFKMAKDSSSMLTVGLVGIILVLLFALASGVGNSQRPVIIKEDCKPKQIFPYKKRGPGSKSDNCPTSILSPAGMCPNRYTNFTDAEGNTLCCASPNIDPYSHKCPASGPSGVCSMAPGLEDRRVPSSERVFYPLCQNLRQEQTASKGASLCPRKYPNYLQSQGSTTFKCCGIIPGLSDTNCPNDGGSCSSLFGNQTVLNTPDSCEAVKLQNSIKCPTGTSLNPKMMITDPKTNKTLFVPSCQGVTNTCYPRSVLTKCRELGGCSKLDIDKSLSNCTVFNSIFNDRTKDLNEVDISGVDFFK